MNKIDQTFIIGCEELIRKGQGNQALEAIKQVPKKEIPRKLLSQIGNLLNRTGGAHYALKLIHPYVRGSYFDLGTDAEKVTYSKSLINIGAQQEGVELLKELKAKDSSLLLTEAFSLFKSWNYDLALPLVEEYVEKTKEDNYAHTIAKINLCSILIFQKKFDVALKQLILLQKNNCEQLQLLNGYILELLGQTYFHIEENSLAEQNLNLSIQALSTSNQKALLYPKKWLALLKLKTTGNSIEILNLKKTAEKALDFETVRDIDYWVGMIQKDPILLSKVYYQTPFQSFRRRIPEELIHNNWFWNKKIGSKPFSSLFGTKLPMSFELTSQLFCFLLSDGYKPVNIGAIHSQLFKGDFYNPATTPDRVYQVISRLNKTLDKELNFKVNTINKSYMIKGEAIPDFNYRIKKSNITGLTSPNEIFVYQLTHLFGKNSFSSKQLASYFKVSQRTANRWIKEAQIPSQGKGKNIKFNLKAS